MTLNLQKVKEQLAQIRGCTLDEVDVILSNILNRSRNFAAPLKEGSLKDEDYYAACLSCGAIILCGPQCCDNFVSQAMLDKKKESTNEKD